MKGAIEIAVLSRKRQACFELKTVLFHKRNSELMQFRVGENEKSNLC